MALKSPPNCDTGEDRSRETGNNSNDLMSKLSNRSKLRPSFWHLHSLHSELEFIRNPATVCNLRRNHSISLTKLQIKDLFHLLAKLGDSDIPIFFDWREAKPNVTNNAAYGIETNPTDLRTEATAAVDDSSRWDRAAVITALVTSLLGWPQKVPRAPTLNCG